jgi:hypothetical protein
MGHQSVSQPSEGLGVLRRPSLSTQFLVGVECVAAWPLHHAQTSSSHGYRYGCSPCFALVLAACRSGRRWALVTGWLPGDTPANTPPRQACRRRPATVVEKTTSWSSIQGSTMEIRWGDSAGEWDIGASHEPLDLGSNDCDWIMRIVSTKSIWILRIRIDLCYFKRASLISDLAGRSACWITYRRNLIRVIRSDLDGS